MKTDCRPASEFAGYAAPPWLGSLTSSRRRSGPRVWLRRALLVVTAFLPQPVKRCVYRWCFGYRIGRKTHIGFSYLDCESLEMADGACIGHLNVFWACGAVHLGEAARVGFANLLRGGKRIDLESYAVVGRLNVINAILEPEVANPTDPCFALGHGAIVVSEHRIDFTDRVSIGRRSILSGRNSSLWTHNRQRTRPIEIGEFCYIGSEIRMAPGSRIPSHSIVGMGAVVIKQIPREGCLIAGIPARVMRPLVANDLALLYYKTRPDLPDIPGVDGPATEPQTIGSVCAALQESFPA